MRDHFPRASIDIDVTVAETADREHHAVGVKRGTSDGAGLCGREERGVGLDGVDGCAVDVEEGEGVVFGAAGLDERERSEISNVGGRVEIEKERKEEEKVRLT